MDYFKYHYVLGVLPNPEIEGKGVGVLADYKKMLKDKLLNLNPISGVITMITPPNLITEKGYTWGGGFTYMLNGILLKEMSYRLKSQKVWLKPSDIEEGRKDDEVKGSGYIQHFVKTNSSGTITDEKRNLFKNRVNKFLADNWVFETEKEVIQICVDMMTEPDDVIFNPFEPDYKIPPPTKTKKQDHKFW